MEDKYTSLFKPISIFDCRRYKEDGNFPKQGVPAENKTSVNLIVESR